MFTLILGFAGLVWGAVFGSHLDTLYRADDQAAARDDALAQRQRKLEQLYLREQRAKLDAARGVTDPPAPKPEPTKEAA